MKDIKCPEGQQASNGVCVANLPTSSTADSSRRPTYPTSSGIDRESETTTETTTPRPTEPEKPVDPAVPATPTTPATPDRPSTPTTPASSGTTESVIPVGLTVKVKIDHFYDTGEVGNPFVLKISFEPRDKVQNLKVQYKAGTPVNYMPDRTPYPIHADISFMYDSAKCEVEEDVFTFVKYYQMEKEFAGSEVIVKCKGGSL